MEYVTVDEICMDYDRGALLWHRWALLMHNLTQPFVKFGEAVAVFARQLEAGNGVHHSQ